MRCVVSNASVSISLWVVHVKDIELSAYRLGRLGLAFVLLFRVQVAATGLTGAWMIRISDLAGANITNGAALVFDIGRAHPPYRPKHNRPSQRTANHRG